MGVHKQQTMTSFYIRPLLTSVELDILSEVLDCADWSKSTDRIPEYLPTGQNNSEMVPGHLRMEASKLLFSAVDRDQGFSDRVFPKNSTDPVFSRTRAGEGFSIHHDATSVGEFSTTVFLSDPGSYDGGELCIYLEEEVRKFKLPAGTAITYLTAAPHCVAEVTSGVRDVGVFWTSSAVRDSRYREILADIRQVRRLLPTGRTYDFNEAMADPEFILQSVEHKLIRHFL
jgi:PKHD-type hydroxylase